jgi:uncharacterized damage-inducible protein DinB
MHHILLATRFWLGLILGRPFSLEAESQAPESLEVLVAQYRETHIQLLEWISKIRQADLARSVETPFIPESSFSLEQALMQVCMHSHGHRSQCATRLRLVGGTPPALDFILWLRDRPAPDWSSPVVA